MVFTIISAAFLLLPFIAGQPEECCMEKRVGDYDYIFVKEGGPGVPSKCINSCIYKRTDNGRMYCFAHGDLHVECEDGPDDGPTPGPDGGAMVISGGLNGMFQAQNNVATVTDRTCAVVVPPLPAPTFGHSMFETNGELLACGGALNFNLGSEYKTCFKLDTKTNMWTFHSNLNLKRLYSSAVKIDGKRCLVGGEDEQNSMECLEGSMWKLSEGVVPGEGVSASCGVNLETGSVVFVGGNYNSSQVIERTATGAWLEWPPLETGVSAAACQVVGSSLVVAGGLLESGQASKATILIDINTQTATEGGDLNEARAAFALSVVDGTLLAAGGANMMGGMYTSVESFDIPSKTWNPTDDQVFPGFYTGFTSVSSKLMKCD